jgi:hypothetical protein
MEKRRWYFRKGQYYFIVQTPQKTSIFFDDNLEVIVFWVEKILQAKAFYEWFRSLTNIRYGENGAPQLD